METLPQPKSRWIICYFPSNVMTANNSNPMFIFRPSLGEETLCLNWRVWGRIFVTVAHNGACWERSHLNPPVGVRVEAELRSALMAFFSSSMEDSVMDKFMLRFNKTVRWPHRG